MLSAADLECRCGFGLWNKPWPGRPRHCMRCGRLDIVDLPCGHLHMDPKTEACPDCGVPWVKATAENGKVTYTRPVPGGQPRSG